MPRFSRPRRRRRDQESFSLRPRWIRRDFSDQSGYGPHQGGYGATKNQFLATKAENPRLSRSRWIRRDFPYQGGDGITFETETETARFSLPGCRRHHFPDRGGDGATKKVFLCDRGGYGATLAIRVDMAHTKVDTAQLSRPRRRRRNQESISRDQGGDAASFQAKAEMARLFGTGRRWRYFPDQRGDGATKKNFPATAVDTARLSIPGGRRHRFPDQGGDGATKKTFLVTAVDTARTFIPGWRRPDFPDQDRIGAFFQTKREMPRFSRPRQIRRD